MKLQIDHPTLLVNDPAPAVATLQEAGLRPVPGELTGGALRFFGFENAYLEILWAESRETLQTLLPTYARKFDALADEHLRKTASPFGFGLRRCQPSTAPPPFATYRFHPPGMPSTEWIEVAAASEDLRQPEICVTSPIMAWDWIVRTQGAYRASLHHRPGLRRLSAVRLHGPGLLEAPAPALRYLLNHALIEIAETPNHLLELAFDDARQGKELDFRATIPLILKY